MFEKFQIEKIRYNQCAGSAGAGLQTKGGDRENQIKSGSAAPVHQPEQARVPRQRTSEAKASAARAGWGPGSRRSASARAAVSESA